MKNTLIELRPLQNKSFNSLVLRMVKTPCGRQKYAELSKKQGFFSYLRLIWFIIFATIKDWNLAIPPNQIEDSDP